VRLHFGQRFMRRTPLFMFRVQALACFLSLKTPAGYAFG
jgi:hypothetical protein